jgi:translation elongation factor EF-Ts
MKSHRSADSAIGEIKPEGMITAKIKLDEIAEKGFVALTEDKDNHVKILVDIGAGI